LTPSIKVPILIYFSTPPKEQQSFNDECDENRVYSSAISRFFILSKNSISKASLIFFSNSGEMFEMV
jgi:hypothetical protein